VRLENFSSFGFAKGRLVFRAKPNVLKCAAGFFFLSFDGRTVGLLGLLVTVCVQAIVALCCACGRAMALARCYRLVVYGFTYIILFSIYSCDKLFSYAPLMILLTYSSLGGTVVKLVEIKVYALNVSLQFFSLILFSV